MDLHLRTDARMAGRVLRYHTWPHIRPQSVGEHSWQVARIIMSIYPEASVAILRHTIVHDIGELRVGDPPYPIKVDNPVLGEEFHRIEHEALSDICSDWGMSVPELSPVERWIFKTAEFLEMWEWGLEEGLLGNKFAGLVAERCLAAVGFRCESLGDLEGNVIISMVIRKVNAYVEKRKSTWLR